MDRNWKCTNCGRVHRKNVRKCRQCGGTTLQQTKEPPTSTIERLLDKLGL